MIERLLENTMYASRWLLAPVYVGLSLALVALSIKFFRRSCMSCPTFSIAEADLILTLLSLVDMALVGGLLVMVMFSGYENFVSQLDITEGKEKLSWLGKMDATSLKTKSPPPSSPSPPFTCCGCLWTPRMCRTTS